MMSNGETREELEYLVNQNIERINAGVSVATIYNEIASEHNTSINPIDVTNIRTGRHLRALAYACIETGFKDVDKISYYLNQEYRDIKEKNKEQGTK